MAKVLLVVNGEESEVGDFESLGQVSVTGPTGQALYRLDPLQDHTVKLVVEGEPHVDRQVELVEEEKKVVTKK